MSTVFRLEEPQRNLIFGLNKMKGTFKQLLFLGLLQYSTLFMLESQQSGSYQDNEKVLFFSDRNLYVTGEQILFSAFIQHENKNEGTGTSSVLYCELITDAGNKITSEKFLTNDCTVSGQLKIPEYLLTGNYYMRAYTKVMRNNGPSAYFYTLLKIVNPYRSEVQQNTLDNHSVQHDPADNPPDKKNDPVIISADKPVYFLHDTVKIAIRGHSTDSVRYMSLAVVPEYSSFNYKVRIRDFTSNDAKTYYFPETRGLSLTGKLRDYITGSLIPDKRVNLSIIGTGRDFMAARTDSEGRFFFQLPDYIGSRDLFLSAENIKNADPRILVDNDFCSIPLKISSDVFKLDQQEREAVYNMAVNRQVQSFFTTDSVTERKKYKLDDQAFYGKPDEVIIIDNYIQLPTLEEYFTELPTYVKVRKHQGEKYFRITGPKSEVSDIKPLVMVDMVAIDDPDKVLAIAPESLSRIEIVNDFYLKGDQTYGGIINFISRKGDFAGIDLPSSGIFVSFRFFSESYHHKEITLPHNVPDTRNTLFWEPLLKPDKKGSVNLSFETSDTPGGYLIVLNGITSRGEVFRTTAGFKVVR